MVLAKDGIDQSERLCERWSITQIKGGEKYPTYNKKKKAKWIGHVNKWPVHLALETAF